MARDPLASLARLRRLETAMARRDLAERLGAVAAAEQRQALAIAAIQQEAAGDAPADYARWLPRGLAERDRADRLHKHAEYRLEEAQTALAGARAAERSVEWLQEERAREQRETQERKRQALLDDAAARRFTRAG